MMLAAIGMAIVAMFIVAGCGGSDSDTTGGGETTASTEGGNGGGEGGSDYATTLAQLTGEGTEMDPPDSSPAPAKGSSVWWVSCGQTVPACSVPANSAKEAADLLGFNYRIADAAQSADGGSLTALRTAIAANPDFIVLHGISCETVKQPLEEAKKQGIKVMGVEGFDCSDPPVNGPELFPGQFKYSEKHPSNLEAFEEWGRKTGEYMIADNEGEMKYIENAHVEPTGQAVQKGFEEAMAKCSGCEKLAEVEGSSADFVPNGPWLQRFRAALVQNPDATTVFFPYDVMADVGGLQAANETLPDAQIYGGSGSSTVNDYIREGKMNASLGHSAVWMGWAAMDNANRVLNGEETVPEGVGYRMVDKDHNLPSEPGATYESPIDFQGAYEAIWKAAEKG